LANGTENPSVLHRAIGLVLHDDSIGGEAEQHQHVAHLSGFCFAVLRIASGDDDRRLREELCGDETRQHATAKNLAHRAVGLEAIAQDDDRRLGEILGRCCWLRLGDHRRDLTDYRSDSED
jgi:hypothetical protein